MTCVPQQQNEGGYQCLFIKHMSLSLLVCDQRWAPLPARACSPAKRYQPLRRLFPTFELTFPIYPQSVCVLVYLSKFHFQRALSPPFSEYCAMNALPIENAQTPREVIDDLVASFGLRRVLLAVITRVFRRTRPPDSVSYTHLTLPTILLV